MFFPKELREKVANDPELILQDVFKTTGKKIARLPKIRALYREWRVSQGLTPFVEIVPIRRNINRDFKQKVSFVNDFENGNVLYGLYDGLDQKGNVKFLPFEPQGIMRFDTRNDNHCDQWIILSLHPLVEGTVFANYSAVEGYKACFKMNDEKLNAIKNIDVVKQMKLAMDRVDELMKNIEYAVVFARYLELDVKTADEAILHSILLNNARFYPETFNAKFENKERNERQIFISGRELGIIKHHITNGFNVNQRNLGLTEDEAIATIKRDANLYRLISDSIKANDQVVKDIVKGIAEKKQKEVLVTEEGPEQEPVM